MVNNPTLFALSESRWLGELVAAALDVPLAQHEERSFEDGEHKIRPLQNVRNRGVFVIQSLYSDLNGDFYGEKALSVNDKLCRLLFFIAALKDASATQVTAVLPYLCYARKDRKTKARDPITSRYIAQLLEGVGADRVVTLDVHNVAAFQNAFRCHTEHLQATSLFVKHFATVATERPVVVVSPDAGGAKRAEAFRQALSQNLGEEVSGAFVEKYRSAGKVSGDTVVGDMQDRIAIIIDDLISTGHTIIRAAHACRQRGAHSVYAVASHGVFTSGAEQALADPALIQWVITNTISQQQLESGATDNKLIVLDAAPLLAEAIKRIHCGGSLVELMQLE
jgi:ribose-phosphate pyrophosphokinase